jgi:hypothetical protein
MGVIAAIWMVWLTPRGMENPQVRGYSDRPGWVAFKTADIRSRLIDNKVTRGTFLHPA